MSEKIFNVDKNFKNFAAKKMRYLIFGGTGFIGSHLLEELEYRGDEAVVFDWLPNNEAFAGLKNKAVALVRGDITNFRDVLFALKEHKPDFVVNLVSVMSNAPIVNDDANAPWPSVEVHSKGMYNILEAARCIPIKRLVWTSTTGVYGRGAPNSVQNEDSICAPFSVYTLVKRLNEFITEYYYQRFLIDSIGLRLTAVYGPRMFRIRSGRKSRYTEFLEDLLTKGAFSRSVTVSRPKEVHDWVYVRDVARAIVLAANAKDLSSRVYQMFGTRSSTEDMVTTAQKLFPDLKIKYSVESPEGDSLAILSRFDGSRARKELGYVPRYSLLEGLELTMNYYARAGSIECG